MLLLPSTIFESYTQYALGKRGLPQNFMRAALNELCQILLVCHGLRHAAWPHSLSDAGDTLWAKFPNLKAEILAEINKTHPTVKIDGRDKFIFDESKLKLDEIDVIKEFNECTYDDKKIGRVLGMGVVVDDYHDVVGRASVVTLEAIILKDKTKMVCNLVHCSSNCLDDANAEDFLEQMEFIAASANTLFENSDISTEYSFGDVPFVARRKWLGSVVVNGFPVCKYMTKDLYAKYHDRSFLTDLDVPEWFRLHFY
jgi:hypothetical protein